MQNGAFAGPIQRGNGSVDIGPLLHNQPSSSGRACGHCTLIYATDGEMRRLKTYTNHIKCVCVNQDKQNCFNAKHQFDTVSVTKEDKNKPQRAQQFVCR